MTNEEYSLSCSLKKIRCNPKSSTYVLGTKTKKQLYLLFGN